MPSNLRPFLVSLSLLHVLALEAQTSREIAKSAFLSSVFIEVMDRYGKPLALGSGFVVSPSLIATNLHVIQGAAKARVNLVGSKTIFSSSTVKAVDPVNDLALLQVPGLLAPSLVLSPETPEVGDRVYAVGNPKGLQGTLSDGLVSAFRDFKTRKLIQISAPISPGSSGGPVLNEKGEVLGMAVGTIEDGQNLNFAIPSGALSDLMVRKSAPVEMTSLKITRENKNAHLVHAVEGIQIAHFTWNKIHDWTTEDFDLQFVVRNLTNTPVKKILIVILLSDRQGAPVASCETEAGWGTNKYGESIFPHAAMSYSVRFSAFDKSLTKSIQYRVLSYVAE